jgi:hypothetical protein
MPRLDGCGRGGGASRNCTTAGWLWQSLDAGLAELEPDPPSSVHLSRVRNDPTLARRFNAGQGNAAGSLHRALEICVQVRNLAVR